MRRDVFTFEMTASRQVSSIEEITNWISSDCLQSNPAKTEIM